MRLLVLGGTRFVGRCVVLEAVRRGHQVTTLNRGSAPPATTAVDARHADRGDPSALASALGDDRWDAVVDTWSGAPVVVRDAARMLAGRVDHYGYVSSRSVYRWPIPSGVDESAPVVDASPDSTDGSDYAAAKRGAELAALEVFGESALLARAGLILGPYEDIGRLPWWLERLARGGRVPTPGPPDRPLQYVDARDLAAFLLDNAEQAAGGTFNTVSRPGHTTIGELLDTAAATVGGDAELAWVAPATVEEAGVSAWTELPIWVPPTGELAALHDADVSAAYARGLRCRPVADTIRDTWDWLRRDGMPPARTDRPGIGLSPEQEQRLLSAAG